MLTGFRPADFGGDAPSIQNRAGNSLFKAVTLQWSRPAVWDKEAKTPYFDSDDPCLYALVRNHGNAQTKDRIEYVGLTTTPKTRFSNHSTAASIVAKRGQVGISYAPIDFIKGRNRIENTKRALEELEHLLIWCLWDYLENDRKMYTLPGMGSRGGNAWHVVCTGYRFSGRMPREIVFPWMLVKPGRDRTQRKTVSG